ESHRPEDGLVMSTVPPDGPDPMSEAHPGIVRRTDGSRTSVPFEQITSLCEEFAHEWQPAQRPDIPSYLDRVAADAQGTLLRNLLQFEVGRRRREGERPQAEEYLHRFPHFAGLVREGFLESTSSAVRPDRSRGA